MSEITLIHRFLKEIIYRREFMEYHQDYLRFRLAQRVRESNIDFLWSEPTTSVMPTTGLQNHT